MKKIRLVMGLLLAFAVSACHKEEVPEVQRNEGEMTIMAYFVADNNLDEYLKQNVTMMCQGLQKMTVPATLLVYWDGKTGNPNNKYWNEPCILKYVTDGKGRLNGQAVDLGATGGQARIAYTHADTLAWEAAEVIPTSYGRSTDKENMIGVLKQMIGLSPSALYYGLIAGSHGSGWLKYITGKNARSFGQDGSSIEQDGSPRNTISTGEMAEAVAAAGKKMDFVLFDACMMGCVEVCYEFRDVADYLITSVVDVPSIGFPYDEMLPMLYRHKVEGYEEACRTYVAFYEKLRSRGYWGTMSLVNCAELDALTAQVRAQLEEHAERLVDYNPVHLQQYGLNRRAPAFKYISFDMKQFVEDLNGQQCPPSFAGQLEKTVLYAGYVENTSNYTIDGRHFCGLGMYVPVSSKNYWNEYFSTLSWYDAAGWSAVRGN